MTVRPVRLDRRVVIVTGAGGGLGRSYATHLAAAGALVVVNDLREAAGTVAAIESAGGRAVADDHDIASEAGARALTEHAVQAFGRIDALVNNAGVYPMGPFDTMPWDTFDLMMKVHVYGTYFVTKHAWPHLVSGGAGRVVMTSSSAALWGKTLNITHYGAAKGAVIGLTRQLALEGSRRGIGVNAIFPNALTSIEHASPAMLERADEFAADLGMDAIDLPALAQRSMDVVAEFVRWLCHPDCVTSGELFYVQGGGAQRVYFGRSRGVHDAALTAEVVRDRFEEIMDPTDAEVLPAFVPGGIVA